MNSVISKPIPSFKQLLKQSLRHLTQFSIVNQTWLKVSAFVRGSRWTFNGEDNRLVMKYADSFSSFQNVKVDVNGDNNQIIIESGVHLKNTQIIINGNHHYLYIGDRCQINGGCLWLSDELGRLTIQADTTIVEANIGVSEHSRSIQIGKDCMLAHGIEIRTGDSHTILDRKTQERINPGASIQIEDHVWIGAHARILKGVSVGKHSVIGMGALVTQSVPEHVIAVGVPAKPKRTDIDWTRENVQTPTIIQPLD